jgi:hypothetical protein
MAQNVVAWSVPKLKGIEQVVQLGEKKAFLPEGLVASSVREMGGSGTADLIIEHHGDAKLMPQAAKGEKILVASAGTAVKHNQPRRVA